MKVGYFSKVLLCLAGVCSMLPAAMAAGGIQGKAVSDTDGSPFAGAAVMVYRSGPAPTLSRTVTTTADGSFAVSGLTPGRYGICVKPASGSFIDPCQWGDLLKTVQVSDGLTAAAGAIRLKPATLLRVRINDAAKALEKKNAETFAPHVLVGVFDVRGMFHPAMAAKKDSAGINYELPIPPDLPVTLRVYSAHVKLETEARAPVSAKGYQEVVLQSQKSPPKQYTFNVTGRM